MTDLQINLENEKLISSTGTYKNEYFTKSIVNYLCGIEKFDILLAGRKFSETKYQFHIWNYKEFISFTFVLKDKEVSIFNLAKTEVIDITLIRHQEIEIDTLGDKEGRIIGLAVIPVVGVVATAVDSLYSAVKKDKLFVKSVTLPNGAIYEVHLNDTQKSKIVISTLEGSFLENINSFFSKAFDFDFSAKFEPKKEVNKNCYIATLCYGDNEAIQVATFRTFRDNVLNKNLLGRIFIKLYYMLSPKLVRVLQNKNRINKFVRNRILDKLFLSIK